MLTRVAVVAETDYQRSQIEAQVQNTGRAECRCGLSFPQRGGDETCRQIRAATIELITLDIPGENSQPALRAIEILSSEFPHIPIVAVGDLMNSKLIIEAMRAGAREFLNRPISSVAVREAFNRLLAPSSARGKLYMMLNSKGGVGATTIAVNTAVMLAASKKVLLVDLASPGNTVLHLNLQPRFSISDVLQNLHRLDACLLKDFVAQCANGLHVLPGADFSTS